MDDHRVSCVVTGQCGRRRVRAGKGGKPCVGPSSFSFLCVSLRRCGLAYGPAAPRRSPSRRLPTNSSQMATVRLREAVRAASLDTLGQRDCTPVLGGGAAADVNADHRLDLLWPSTRRNLASTQATPSLPHRQNARRNTDRRLRFDRHQLAADRVRTIDPLRQRTRCLVPRRRRGKESRAPRSAKGSEHRACVSSVVVRAPRAPKTHGAIRRSVHAFGWGSARDNARKSG
jgi:hypothetical protein